MEEQVNISIDKTAAFSPREFILKHLKYIPWLVLSTVLFLVLAFIKLRYSPIVYQVQSKLMIKKDGRGAGQGKFAELFMGSESQNLNDEVQILKSSGISKRIVHNLNLQLYYVSEGNVKSYQLHPKESPFWLEILELKDSTQAFTITVNFINENTINIDNSPKPVYMGQVIEKSYGKVRFIKSPTNYQQYGSSLFAVSWIPLEDIADGIAGSFNVTPINDYSNVLLVTLETENPRLGRDIVNQLMQEYNLSSIEDKRIVTKNTLEFIEESVDTLKRELSNVELMLQNYREKYKAINLEQQSIISFSELNSANNNLTVQEVQLKILNYLTTYLEDERNIYKTVPTSLGISEPSLQALISLYNTAQLKRETQLNSTTPANAVIKILDIELEKLREQIRENLKNIQQSYLITRDNLIAKSKLAEGEISEVPGKGRRLLEITRQQKILEDLYSFLLQKKLETSISSASTISNSKVLEPAKSLSVPLRPDRKGIYILAVLLGLGVPIAIIALKEYLNDKITSRQDVEKLTQAPILGEIGHSDGKETLVVTQNNRKFIAEQFRIIRTNLQFILNKVERPVLLVTSSFSGEGKSFVSTNMGSVLALTGKKTVILEFDIRKPKIIAGLDLKGKKGLTNFIVGNASIQEIIIPVVQVENLYVIPCGPIPPNPAELLLDEKVKELFDYLKGNFDAIIIDSAPLGLVSDAVILSIYADATLYIMRQDYTLKKQLGLVNELYKKNKLPKISILLNDVKNSSTYGGYYGNYGYGKSYGYGYGHGGEYFEEENKSKAGILNKIKRVFKRK
ncbi:MAG: polysaccharide biosynthesis tyrosine autokinase [Chitinophagaceae bacterium]